MMKPMILCMNLGAQPTFANPDLVSMAKVLPTVQSVDWQAQVQSQLGANVHVRGLEDIFLVVKEGTFQFDTSQGGFVKAEVYRMFDEKSVCLWGLGTAETRLVDCIRELVHDAVHSPVWSTAFIQDGVPMIKYWLDKRPDITYIVTMDKLYHDSVERSVKEISAYFRRLAWLVG